MAQTLQNPTLHDVYNLLLELQTDVKSIKDDINSINIKVENITTRLIDVESGTAKLEEDMFELSARVNDMSDQLKPAYIDHFSDVQAINDTL